MAIECRTRSTSSGSGSSTKARTKALVSKIGLNATALAKLRRKWRGSGAGAPSRRVASTSAVKRSPEVRYSVKLAALARRSRAISLHGAVKLPPGAVRA